MAKSISKKSSNDKEIIFPAGLGVIKASLRIRIRLYQKRLKEIEEYLIQKPNDWGKFQQEFNREVDGIFSEIMNFEKINFANGNHERVKKLKAIFEKRIRKIFTGSGYGKWSLDKPYGYSGDFKIIDDIYQNAPTTTGIDRLFDNYYQMSAIAVAGRNRKKDFKRLISNAINEKLKEKSSLRVMSLASGSSRKIKEVLSANPLFKEKVIFDCYDQEEDALRFAKKLLSDFSNINFFKENIYKIILSKKVASKIKYTYDIIYSTGLFDYLSHDVAVRLIKNVKSRLNPEGKLMIANVRDRYSNPSVHYMEWMADWELIYKTDEDFRKIFIEAGFKNDELETQHERQGIIQYVIASLK